MIEIYGTERFNGLDSKKRTAVLAAATTEFARFGYLAASTNRISAAAGVSKGALFSYFSTKEALFTGVIRSQFELIEKEAPTLLADVDPGPLAQRLTALALRQWELHQRAPSLFVLGWVVRDAVRHITEARGLQARYAMISADHIHALVQDARARGELADNMSDESVTFLLESTMQRLRDQLWEGSENATSPENLPTLEQYAALATSLCAAVSRGVAR